jgi:hypothetical protein
MVSLFACALLPLVAAEYGNVLADHLLGHKRLVGPAIEICVARLPNWSLNSWPADHDRHVGDELGNVRLLALLSNRWV